MFGHLAFASTTSKKYGKIAQKSPARVVYVVREPRPEASVAVRSERPGVSRKCSPTLWLKWCSSRSSARLRRSPRSQRRSALVFPTSSPALVNPRAAGPSNSSTLTVVLQSARWSPGVEIKVESGHRTLHIRSRRGYTISYASNRASRAAPSAPRCVYSCTV